MVVASKPSGSRAGRCLLTAVSLALVLVVTVTADVQADEPEVESAALSDSGGAVAAAMAARGLSAQAVAAALSGAAARPQPEPIAPQPSPGEPAPEPALAVQDAELAQALLDDGRSQSEAASVTSRETPASWRSFSVLFLGAGLVVVAGWALARRQRVERKGKTWMRHLQSIKLGPKQQIAVVEVAGRYLAVGIADGSIQLLKELSGPPSSAPSPAATSPQQAWSPLLLDALKASQTVSPPRLSAQGQPGPIRSGAGQSDLGPDGPDPDMASQLGRRLQTAQCGLTNSGPTTSWLGELRRLPQRLADKRAAHQAARDPRDTEGKPASLSRRRPEGNRERELVAARLAQLRGGGRSAT